jgi:hypothetical protein
MQGAKRANSRHQFSSVEELQGLMRSVRARFPSNSRYDYEVRAFVSLSLQVGEEADDLDSLAEACVKVNWQ